MADTRDSSSKPASADHTAGWRTATLFVLTAVGIVASLLFIHALLFPVVATFAFAVVLQGPHRKLRRHLGPSTTSGVLIAALCVAVMLPGFFVVRSLSGEVMATIAYVRSGQADQEFHQLTDRHQKVGKLLQKGVDQLSPDQAGKRLAGSAALWVGRGLQGFITGFTELVLMLFLLFFLLRDQEAPSRHWPGWCP